MEEEPEPSELEAQAGKLVSGRRGLRLKPQKPQWPGKQNVIDAINELIEELDNIQTAITAQGVEHIHANEVRACVCVWCGCGCVGVCVRWWCGWGVGGTKAGVVPGTTGWVTKAGVVPGSAGQGGAGGG